MKNFLLLKIIAIVTTFILLNCCTQKPGTIGSNEDLGFSNNGNHDDIDNSIYDSKAVSESKPVEIDNSQFVEGSKDVPLASGLKKSSDDNLDFDFASGNIASIIYKNENGTQNVKDFYLKTLPQLGWQAVKNKQKNSNMMKFSRDGEKLEIEFFNKDNNDFVKFLVIIP